MKTPQSIFAAAVLAATVSLLPSLVAEDAVAPGTKVDDNRPTRTPDDAATTGASRALNSGAMVMKARQADFGARDEIVAKMSDGIAAAARALTALGERAGQFKGDVKTEFKAAMDRAHVRADQARKSIDTARNAPAEKWPEARNNLAADYEAYGAAVARVESIAAIGEAKSDAKVGAAGTVETKTQEPKSGN